MKNVDEFVEKMVKIDWCENINQFGHYPFQLFVEDKEGEISLVALLLAQTEMCLDVVAGHINKGAKKIYLSMDYPAKADMKNDYVMILSIENDDYKAFAICYNNQNGEIIENIYDSFTIKHFVEYSKNYIESAMGGLKRRLEKFVKTA